MSASFRLRPMIRTIWRWTPLLASVALVAFLVAAGALSQLNSDQAVETRALVLVKDLEISIDDLAPSIEVVWNRSGVAARAIEIGGLAFDEAELRTDVIEVIGVRGTPLVQVVAQGDDAEQLVAAANAVAEALAATMNESGGLGSFEVFEPASLERSAEPTQLPTVPLAVFAALVAVLVALVVGFIIVSPVHTRADLAVASEAEFVEEAWIETGPPILGAARALAERLAELDVEVRLVHSGRGDDLTLPMAALINRLNPRVRVAGSLRNAAPSRAADEVRDVLLIPEGMPRRQVVRAEATARRLIVSVLVHEDLA